MLREAVRGTHIVDRIALQTAFYWLRERFIATVMTKSRKDDDDAVVDKHNDSNNTTVNTI